MNPLAKIAVFILAPTLVHAAPKHKQKESIVVEVASTKTNVYTSYTRSTSMVRSKLPKDAYTYTDVIFAVVNEKHVVYACAEKNKACPLLENGSKLTAEQDGDSIVISTTVPSEKKPLLTHYKLVGNGW